MKLKPNAAVATIPVLLILLPLVVQVRSLAQRRPASNLSGIWHPVVGSGGAYEWMIGDDKHPLETTVVGKEDVEGKTDYWVETVSTNPNGGQLYFKALMVVNDGGVTSARTIVQRPGQAAVETDTCKNPAGQQARPVSPWGLVKTQSKTSSMG